MPKRYKSGTKSGTGLGKEIYDVVPIAWAGAQRNDAHPPRGLKLLWKASGTAVIARGRFTACVHASHGGCLLHNANF